MVDAKDRATKSLSSVGLWLVLHGLVFLFGLVLVSAPARAQESYDARLQRLHEEFIKEDPSYELAVQLCQGNGEAFATVYESARNEVLRLFSSPAQVIARGHENGYIPPEIKLLLDSEAFDLAMRTCENRVAVLERMQTADVNGKAVGLMAVGAAYVALRLGGAKLSAKAAGSQAATYTVNALYGMGFLGFMYQLQQVIVKISTRKIEQAKTKAEVEKTNLMLKQDRATLKREQLEEYQRDLAFTELSLASGLVPPAEIAEARRRADALRRVIARRSPPAPEVSALR